MPRLFVAFDLAEGARAALAALADVQVRGKWTAPSQLHLTLRFLGSVAPEQVPPIAAALAQVKAPRFEVALAGVGVFPAPSSHQPARVLWAGVAPAEPVRGLKAAVDQVLGPDPESQERGFSPHVTLARLGRGPRAAVAEFLSRHASLATPAWTVSSYRLYESRTLPEGATYVPLHTYALQPPG